MPTLSRRNFGFQSAAVGLVSLLSGCAQNNSEVELQGKSPKVLDVYKLARSIVMTESVDKILKQVNGCAVRLEDTLLLLPRHTIRDGVPDMYYFDNDELRQVKLRDLITIDNQDFAFASHDPLPFNRDAKYPPTPVSWGSIPKGNVSGIDVVLIGEIIGELQIKRGKTLRFEDKLELTDVERQPMTKTCKISVDVGQVRTLSGSGVFSLDGKFLGNVSASDEKMISYVTPVDVIFESYSRYFPEKAAAVARSVPELLINRPDAPSCRPEAGKPFKPINGWVEAVTVSPN